MRKLCKVTLSLALVGLLASPALAQGQRQRPGGGGFGRGVGNLLTNKSVQDEIKLSKEQKDKLDEANKKVREKMQDSFAKLRDLPAEERREKGQALQKEITAELTKAADLSNDQKKRYEQITLQVRGTRAFTDEAVQKKLALTDTQKETIKTTLKERDDKVKEETKDLDRRNDGQKIREIRQKLSKEAEAKIAGTLTSEQKKTWTEMIGDKFEVKFEPRQGGRRQGGQGTPGQGGRRRPGGTPPAPRSDT